MINDFVETHTLLHSVHRCQNWAWWWTRKELSEKWRAEEEERYKGSLAKKHKNIRSPLGVDSDTLERTRPIGVNKLFSMHIIPSKYVCRRIIMGS
jgi:hypothetical protein